MKNFQLALFTLSIFFVSCQKDIEIQQSEKAQSENSFSPAFRVAIQQQYVLLRFYGSAGLTTQNNTSTEICELNELTLGNPNIAQVSQSIFLSDPNNLLVSSGLSRGINSYTTQITINGITASPNKGYDFILSCFASRGSITNALFFVKILANNTALLTNVIVLSPPSQMAIRHIEVPYGNRIDGDGIGTGIHLFNNNTLYAVFNASDGCQLFAINIADGAMKYLCTFPFFRPSGITITGNKTRISVLNLNISNGINNRSAIYHVELTGGGSTVTAPVSQNLNLSNADLSNYIPDSGFLQADITNTSNYYIGFSTSLPSIDGNQFPVSTNIYSQDFFSGQTNFLGSTMHVTRSRSVISDITPRYLLPN